MEPTLPTLEEMTKPGAVIAPPEPAKTETPAEPTEPAETEKPPVVQDTKKTDDSPSSLLKTDDTPEPDSSLDGEQRQGESTSAWKKRLKSEAESYKNQAAQLRAELEKIRDQKGGDDKTGKLTALEQEAKELREQLEITAFERSPKFKAEYLEPIKTLEQSIRGTLADLVEEPGVADKALGLTGKARLDYLKDALGDNGAALLVHEKVKDLEALQSKKDAAIQDSQKRAEALAKTESNQVTSQHLEKFDSLIPQMRKQLSVFRPIEGNDEHNAAVEKSLELARDIIAGKAHVDDILTAPLLAVAAPMYIEQNKTLAKENASLKARIAEYESANPEIKGKGNDGGKETAPASFKMPSLKELENSLRAS